MNTLSWKVLKSRLLASLIAPALDIVDIMRKHGSSLFRGSANSLQSISTTMIALKAYLGDMRRSREGETPAAMQ
jgi:hypothetical protein